MAEKVPVHVELKDKMAVNSMDNHKSDGVVREDVMKEEPEQALNRNIQKVKASESAPKKKGSFQITSVKGPAAGDHNPIEDADSVDDLDETCESHTEDVSSEILDCSKATDIEPDPSSEDTMHNLCTEEICKQDAKANDNQSRFKVVKIESKEPFKRGRWKCLDFLDPPTEKSEGKSDEVGSGNSSASSSIHYIHGVDDPSKNPLGGALVVQAEGHPILEPQPVHPVTSQGHVVNGPDFNGTTQTITQSSQQPQVQPFEQSSQGTVPSSAGQAAQIVSPQDSKSQGLQSVPGTTATQPIDTGVQPPQNIPQSIPSQTVLSTTQTGTGQAGTVTPSPSQGSVTCVSGQNTVPSTGNGPVSAKGQNQTQTSVNLGQAKSVVQSQGLADGTQGACPLQAQQSSQNITVQPPQVQNVPVPQTETPPKEYSTGDFHTGTAKPEYVNQGQEFVTSVNTGQDFVQQTQEYVSQQTDFSQPSQTPSGPKESQSQPNQHSTQQNPVQNQDYGSSQPNLPTSVPSQSNLGQQGNTSGGDYANVNQGQSSQTSLPQPTSSNTSPSTENAKTSEITSKDAAVGQADEETSSETGQQEGESNEASGGEATKSIAQSILTPPLLQMVSASMQQPFMNTFKEEGDESGASTVAIDNKIEQAMDLVKSHLMFAVREEVEVLKEQIKELIEKNSQLEYENNILKKAASPETLAQLNQSSQPPATS